MIDLAGEQRRPRMLLVAHACNPERGSEAAVGWNRARCAAERYDTWVLCEKRLNEAGLGRYQQEHGEVPGLHFELVPTRPWEDRLWDFPGLGYLAYRLWHRRAYQAARRLHAELDFDLAHQVTYCSYREPGYLWRLGVPFVWGPVGGTQNYPWRFLAEAGPRGAVAEACRSLANWLQLRTSRRVRSAARAAVQGGALLTANTTIQRDLAHVLGIQPEVQLEIGTRAVALQPRPQGAAGQPLRILWSGDLERWKALSLLIKALAKLPADVPYELRVLGRGSLERRWRRLAQATGIERHTTWMGWLPYAEALEQYAWADVFVFSSLRDTSGSVVLEALSAGVPVVGLDHQGVRDVVTDGCGIKVPVTTPREVAGQLSEALERLARDPAERQRLSQGALARAREYLWSRQSERMEAVYERVLEQADTQAKAHSGSCPKRRERIEQSIRDLGKRTVGNAALVLNQCLGNRAGNRFGILLYHRVTEHAGGAPRPSMNVTPRRLRQQLSGLLRRGFQPSSLSSLLEAQRRGEPVAPRSFAVTFDDGFASVYSQAWPILRELNVPATVFVSTAYLDQMAPLPFDPWGMAWRSRTAAAAWRPLTTAECAEMLDSGLIELGSHTHTHADFRGRVEAFRHDLRQSVEVLEERFGLSGIPFAFPYGKPHTGYVDGEMLSAARSTGVSCALTTAPLLVNSTSDPFGWGRFNVYEWDTGPTIAARLAGWYSWASRLQESFSGLPPAESRGSRPPEAAPSRQPQAMRTTP